MASQWLNIKEIISILVSMILLFTHKKYVIKKELQYLCGFYINLKVECEIITI